VWEGVKKALKKPKESLKRALRLLIKPQESRKGAQQEEEVRGGRCGVWWESGWQWVNKAY
jgi:hypothetical protein